MAGYRKKVSYLDYLENGMKIRNAGFVRIEEHDGQTRLEMQVKNIPEQFAGQYELKADGGGTIGRISLARGCGSCCVVWQGDRAGETGRRKMTTGGIYIRLPGRRLVQTVWPEPWELMVELSEEELRGEKEGGEKTDFHGERAWPHAAENEGIKEAQPGTSDRPEAELPTEPKGQEKPEGPEAAESPANPEGEAEAAGTPEAAERPANPEEEIALPPGAEYGSGAEGKTEELPSGTEEGSEESTDRAEAETEENPSGTEGDAGRPEEDRAAERPETARTDAPKRGEASEPPGTGRPEVSAREPEEETVEMPVNPIWRVEMEPEMTIDSRPEREEREEPACYGDKWEQLSHMYPRIRPFEDEREYLSIAPKDFVVLRQEYQRMVHNSFLLHGYYNYKHLILGKIPESGAWHYYLGVPGNFYNREKMVAEMFGFEAFEGEREPVKAGDFGYFMKRVEI